MIVIWVTLLVVSLPIGWVLTLFGLPGNWLMVLAAASYSTLVPIESKLSIGWPIVGVLVGLAVLAELLEVLAAALGVAKAGGSKRSTIFALFGSLIGSVIGAFVGLPVPVIGSAVAVVLFGSFGALLGAVLGEDMVGRSSDDAMRVGVAAFWGRLLGTVGKTVFATAMVVVTIVALAHP